MKCFVPEISWHNRDPVYSVDFQPKNNKNETFYRLASGGADCHVVIWHVTLTPNDDENQLASFECAADLLRHQKCVNVVRFSPCGQYLASGDDDGYIILWKMREDVDPPELPGSDGEKDKESWISWQVLRGHLQDVYDIAWSPDSMFIVSGSIDNTAIVWEVRKKKSLGFLGEHKGFVQGVAWDPKNKFIATLSGDRNLRVFDTTKRKQVAKCYKGKLPSTLVKDKENDVEKEKMGKFFHNDTLKTFFRRLAFSPFGELLIAPCGVIENENKNQDMTYLFSRGSYSKPAVFLPSPGLYTVAAKCCPVVYKLRGLKSALCALPYRVIIAIATRNSLVIHDTEQLMPFGYVGNIHYTGVTDITWAPDGRLLIASSSEGFCSVITFEEGEIGEEYSERSTQTEATNCDRVEESDLKMDVDVTVEKTPEKKTGLQTTPTKSDNALFRLPGKHVCNMDSLNDSQESQLSDLSVCIACDEADLISKEEQARRLMSPYRDPSSIPGSPCRGTPKMSPKASPRTPKSGRRVNLITISSPKSKQAL